MRSRCKPGVAWQGHARVTVGDEQVEVAGGDQVVASRGFDVGQRQAYVRVFVPEYGQCAWQQHLARARKGTQGQSVRWLTHQGTHRRFGITQLTQNTFTVFEQDSAGLGEPHPGTATFDQKDTDLALELGELLGQGGWGEGKTFGRGGDRTGVGDFHQHTQPVGVQHLPLPSCATNTPWAKALLKDL